MVQKKVKLLRRVVENYPIKTNKLFGAMTYSIIAEGLLKKAMIDMIATKQEKDLSANNTSTD